ncbi:Uncharacterised protein [Bordetella pertussis]|nr:Uncharacterised protein [Bordetella pertussis]
MQATHGTAHNIRPGTGQRRPDHRAAQRRGKHRPRCACDHSDRLAAPGNRQGKQR